MKYWIFELIIRLKLRLLQHFCMSLLSTLRAEFDECEYEAIKEIILKYKKALSYIGVDFEDERVIEVIVSLSLAGGLEDSFQAVINYWYFLERKEQKIDYPSECLIAALNEFWKPSRWENKYLQNPLFKPQTLLWWEEMEKHLGRDFMSQSVADYGEDEGGFEYVLLTDGTRINFRLVKKWIGLNFNNLLTQPHNKEKIYLDLLPFKSA